MTLLGRPSLLARAASPEALIAAYRTCRPSARPDERQQFDRRWPEQMAGVAGALRAGRMPGTAGRRRFSVQKSDGTSRRIEVPSLPEAIAQRAVLDVLGPVLERRFLDCSFGYRPRRDRVDAAAAVSAWHRAGATHAFRADIANCFESLDHRRLRRAVRRLVPDARLAKLLCTWLDSVGEERRTGCWALRGARRVGVPQGAVLSPVLANIYLQELDRACVRARLRYVRYGDDVLVAAVSAAAAERAGRMVSGEVRRLRLQLSASKTAVVPLEGCQFLGLRLPLLGASARRPDPFGSSTYWLRRRLEPRPS